MLGIMVVSVFSIYLTATLIYGVLGLPEDLPSVKFTQQMAFHILTGFILVPFALRLPSGKVTYKRYLDEIGLTRIRPFVALLIFSISCGLILAASQATASIVYRIFQGYPIEFRSLKILFNLSSLSPSKSPDILLALPSAFEEVAFRGVALTVFLRKYTERKSIIFSSIGFSAMHLLNLTSGRELLWVLGQLLWTFILGLAYGYMFVKTNSLMPSMFAHFLGNATINALAGYMITQASIEMEIVYQIVIAFGILPSVLMIFWTRFFTAVWLRPGQQMPRIHEDFAR